MFSSISWSDYFIGAAITFGCHYFIVIICCYRKEISDLLTGNRNNSSKSSKIGPEDSVEELEQVVGEVNGILVAAGKEADKSELLEQLKERLASFAGLRRPAYRVALNNYIIRYAKTFCGVAFSEEELEEVWETLLR